MIHLNENLSSQKLSELRVAGIYLFGAEHAMESDFINKLTAAAIKNAFRKKARRYHPDMRTHEHPELVEKNRERFLKVKESYDVLQDFVAAQQSGA